jgi:hypothetical protein
MAGPNALNIDSAASGLLDPNILSPNTNNWIHVNVGHSENIKHNYHIITPVKYHMATKH